MNRTPRRWLLVLALMAPLVSAQTCPSLPVVRILQPVDGEAVTWGPLFLEVDLWAFADFETLQITLNGVDVTDFFEPGLMVAGRRVIEAAFVWDTGLVVPGSNLLVVSVEGWQAQRLFEAEGDPFADEVFSFAPGTGAGFGQGDLPGVVTGPPEGLGLFEGGLDVLSLGASGEIVLEFVDNVVVDGPGVDLTVFENPFLTLVLGVVGDPFAEPGLVAVSQDGVSWHTFTACETSPVAPPWFPGCAGVFPTLSDALDPGTPHASIPTETGIDELVGLTQAEIFLPDGSGGDSFDLADVGLAWARYVRIQDVGPALGQSGTVGFDLDAVAAVNSVVATDDDGNGVPDAVE